MRFNTNRALPEGCYDTGTVPGLVSLDLTGGGEAWATGLLTAMRGTTGAWSIGIAATNDWRRCGRGNRGVRRREQQAGQKPKARDEKRGREEAVKRSVFHVRHLAVGQQALCPDLGLCDGGASPTNRTQVRIRLSIRRSCAARSVVWMPSGIP